jgi:hypothetical protein
MFIIRTKCAVCEEFHDARNKNCRTRQQKIKKTRSTKIDEISFYSVKQTSIRFVVMLCSSFFEVHFSFSSVKREELLASQNDFQNRISSFESTSSELASESDSCSLVVAFALDNLFAVTFVDAFIQYSMILLMTSSTHLNWQTIMTQMREQNRQIITLFIVVSQLVSSITKFKRKLIVMFSNEDLTFTNSQRFSNKRVVKSTKRV